MSKPKKIEEEGPARGYQQLRRKYEKQETKEREHTKLK